MKKRNVWLWLAVIIPLVGGGLGVHYWVKKSSPFKNLDIAAALKPSFFKNNAEKLAQNVKDKNAAQTPQKQEDEFLKFKNVEVKNYNVTPGSNECLSLEYAGYGEYSTKINSKDWAALREQYHSVKGEYLAWLDKHKLDFSERAYQRMNDQVRNVKLIRPTLMEEPDLAWRGIGVLATVGSEQFIRLGGGFMALYKRSPQRARFELSRLVAQTMAPCELVKAGVDDPWLSASKCMGVPESQGAAVKSACAIGSYSEAGWAISTALAATLSPPGCVIPAFKTPEMAACLKQSPFATPVKTALLNLEQIQKAVRQ